MPKIGELLLSIFGENNLKIAQEKTSVYNSWQCILEDVFSDQDDRAFFSAEKEKAKGRKIAEHSRIVDFSNGILTIEVDHSGWIQILKSKYDKIINVIRKNFQENSLKEINFLLRRNIV
jgi:hypothetical protein